MFKSSLVLITDFGTISILLLIFYDSQSIIMPYVEFITIKRQTKTASSGCKQITIKHYDLSFRDGYVKSSCDCMECSALGSDFPFVARRNELLDNKLGLDSSLKDDLMFMDWFLKLSRMGRKVRLCPDILYITHQDTNGKNVII